MKLLFFLITFFVQHKPTMAKLSFQRSPSKNLRFANFLHLHGYRLNVPATATLEVKKDIKCTSTCMRKEDCFSFNVEKKPTGIFLCEFLNTSKYAFPEKMIPDSNFVHWYLQDFCLPPCPEGTKCLRDEFETTGKLCGAFDPNYNFALGKPTASSSSYYELMDSHVAVDGDKTGYLRVNGVQKCTHTTGGDNLKWWRVDLKSKIPVARVVITNRINAGIRLSNFEIKIGNSLVDDGILNPKCGDRHSVGEGLTEAFVCVPPITGQYVVIQSFYTEVLTICEVEVYAG